MAGMIIAALIQAVSGMIKSPPPPPGAARAAPSVTQINKSSENLQKVGGVKRRSGSCGTPGSGTEGDGVRRGAHGERERGCLMRHWWATKRLFVISVTPVHTETNVTLIRSGEGPLSSNCVSASLTIMQLIPGPLEDMRSKRDIFLSLLSLFCPHMRPRYDDVNWIIPHYLLRQP